MEKTCPRKEGHPPSRVNFSECLYEKKVDPFAPGQQRSRMPWLSRLDGVDPTRRAKVFIWRKVGPARRVTRLRGSPFQPSQLFVCHVNGSPSFVRKCRKSWLAQGSLGRRVTLLPGTTFLHINGASDIFLCFLIPMTQSLHKSCKADFYRPTHFNNRFLFS